MSNSDTTFSGVDVAGVCCKYHFHVMVESYLGVLKGDGRILTDQLGMDWYHGEVGWPMTDADLVSLESRFPVRVSRVTATVYALAARPVKTRALSSG